MDTRISGITYLKKPSGAIKVLQIIFSLIALICSSVQQYCWRMVECTFFSVICIFCLIFASVMLVISIGNLGSADLPWRKINLMANFILTILIFTSTALITPSVSAINYNALKAAAAFGYLNGFTFFGITTFKIIKP